jgi:hypothetical protein
MRLTLVRALIQKIRDSCRSIEEENSLLLSLHDQQKQIEETKTMQPTTLCTICSTPTSSRCSRCHQTYYCGRECQRNDFACHKLSCETSEDAKRKEQGKRMFALPQEHPERKAMGEFYAQLTKEQIANMMLSDPHYLRRKLELQALLLPHVVRQLWDAARGSLDVDLKDPTVRGCALVFLSTQAIVRAVKNQRQEGDFGGMVPLSMTELEEGFPQSVALKTHKENPNILFVTVAEVVPLQKIRPDLQNLTVHHTLTGFQKSALV